jgi:hypothetical protein
MEHRLIFRTSNVKYNSRTAEANAIVQDETRKQSLLANASSPQQAAIIGATSPQEQADLEAARQRLGEAQAVYTNQAQGNASQLDTATGKVTAVPQQGVIEQTRNARLDANNATPEQRATNQQNLQGIMDYRDTSTLEPITNAGVVETPQQFEQRKAAVEQQNAAKAEQDQVKQEQMQATADRNAANTAAGAKAGKQAEVQTLQGSNSDRVSTMLDGIIAASGDPMGPVYKEMMMQELQDKEDAEANAALSRDASMQRAEEQDNDVQSLIDKYTKIHRENNAAYTKLLDETRDSQQKYLAEQEQRDKSKLAWDADMETQKLTKQKTQQLLSQSIQNALGGGAFSGAANEQLASTEREWDTAISNLAAEFSFKEADVSAFYTQKYVDTNNQFNMDVFNAAKMLDEKVEGYAMQGFNSLQARKNAEAAAQNQYRTDITNAKTNYSTKVSGYVKEIQGMVATEKKEKMDREDRALERIDYLLDNYPREAVAEAIKELGQDVTSFDVQALIDNPTLAEIEKAKKARGSGGGGGGYAMSFLPSGMQDPPKPEVSFDDYMKGKIAELESTSMQSFSPEKRAQLMFDNAEKWEKEYNAVHVDGLTGAAVGQAKQQLTQQFGDAVVQAAQLVMDGTYSGTDPVGKAAKTMGVSSAQVATALTQLRQSGAVADTSVLSPEQQKAWKSLRTELEKDSYYTTYKGAVSAVARIETALNQKDGLSDIAAINGFQNGIVDPGATVRSEDVGLIQSANSWADSVDLNYWKGKVNNGDKLPQAMRDKMAQLARSITAAYERNYVDLTLPRFEQEVQQSGVPKAVLDLYRPKGKVSTVSPEVQSFTDSYFK